MKRKKRAVAVLLLALTLLAGGLGWIAYEEGRQQKLQQQLIAAIKRHDARAVIALLDAGVDPNTQDRSDHGKVGLWTLLRRRWTGPSLETAYDPTALATVFGWSQVLTDDKRGFVPERPADIAITQALAAKGANVNVPMANGWPVLFGPIRIGYEKCAECLLDHGADANAANPGGFTVLMCASENSSIQNVRMLLDHGARVNAIYQGVTALKYADLSRNPAIKSLLLKAGARR